MPDSLKEGIAGLVRGLVLTLEKRDLSGYGFCPDYPKTKDRDYKVELTVHSDLVTQITIPTPAGPRFFTVTVRERM